MSLTQPNQDLKRDLRSIASDLKWPAVELTRIADRLSQSGNEEDVQQLQAVAGMSDRALIPLLRPNDLIWSRW